MLALAELFAVRGDYLRTPFGQSQYLLDMNLP